MILYHGSKNIIDKPIPYESKKDNDYGAGFYLTKDLLSAHEWACRNNSVGYVNKYELNDKKLNILDLTDSQKYSVLNWLAILLHFRTLDEGFIKSFKTRLDYIEKHYYIDVNNYDVVKGFRSDDAYFRFPLDFVRGNITLEQLEEAFKLGDLGIQYVLISFKAFESLKYKESFLSNRKYINAYYQNVYLSSKRYDALDKDIDGTRIIDIMRMKP